MIKKILLSASLCVIVSQAVSHASCSHWKRPFVVFAGSSHGSFSSAKKLFASSQLFTHSQCFYGTRMYTPEEATKAIKKYVGGRIKDAIDQLDPQKGAKAVDYLRTLGEMQTSWIQAAGDPCVLHTADQVVEASIIYAMTNFERASRVFSNSGGERNFFVSLFQEQQSLLNATRRIADIRRFLEQGEEDGRRHPKESTIQVTEFPRAFTLENVCGKQQLLEQILNYIDKSGIKTSQGIVEHIKHLLGNVSKQ